MICLSIAVIVKLDCTLRQLREAIRMRFKLLRERSPRDSPYRRAISWKYVWRKYGLMFGEEKLLDMDKQLRDYGIQNKSELRFFQIFQSGLGKRKINNNKASNLKKYHQKRK